MYNNAKYYKISGGVYIMDSKLSDSQIVSKISGKQRGLGAQLARLTVRVIAPTGDDARLIMVAEEQAGPAGVLHSLLSAFLLPSIRQKGSNKS